MTRKHRDIWEVESLADLAELHAIRPFVWVHATETLYRWDGGTGSYVSLSASGVQLPQNSQSAAYTTVLADAGKHILHPVSDENPRTFTIAANANVAYPIGTEIHIVNMSGPGLIIESADTLRIGPISGAIVITTANRAAFLKIAATQWLVTGSSGVAFAD